MVVAVEGTAQALEVTVRRAGAGVTERLPPATCETATDAVAAFLASALGPPPGAPAPVALDELERALGQALARRGVQLAMLGVRLRLARDSEGNVSALIEHRREPACTEKVALGVIDAATDETVSAASDVLHDALAAEHPCPAAPVVPPPVQVVAAPTDAAEPARVRALRDTLDRVPMRPNVGLGVVLLTNGVVVAAVALDRTPPANGSFRTAVPDAPGQRAMLAFGNGVLIGGGLGTAVLPGDRSQSFGMASMFGGYGLMSLSSFFGGTTFAQRATGTGMLMSAGLAALNVARPLPLARLSADRDAAHGPNLTRARAAQIERDVQRAEPVVRNWVVVGPAVAGSTLAAVEALASGDEPSMLLVVDVTFAACSGALSVVDALMGSPWQSYKRALRSAGLTDIALGSGPTPLGFSLSGRF